jgi:hypothetical protein
MAQFSSSSKSSKEDRQFQDHQVRCNVALKFALQLPLLLEKWLPIQALLPEIKP